jgi:hypothetical protein
VCDGPQSRTGLVGSADVQDIETGPEQGTGGMPYLLDPSCCHGESYGNPNAHVR